MRCILGSRPNAGKSERKREAWDAQPVTGGECTAWRNVRVRGFTQTSPSDIPTGRVFTYRLTWRCAGAVSPADDCNGLKITDQLPAYIEYIPPATFASPVVSVTPSGAAAANGATRQTLTVAFDAVVPAGSTGVIDIPVRYISVTTPNGITSVNAVRSTSTRTRSRKPEPSPAVTACIR